MVRFLLQLLCRKIHLEICLCFERFKVQGALELDTAKMEICIVHYMKQGGAKIYNFAIILFGIVVKFFSLLPERKLGLKVSESNTLTCGYYK